MKAKTTINTEKNAADRPSLYSFNKEERNSREIFSILDALEPRVRKSAIWWRTALVGLVGVLAGSLYLVGRDIDVYHQLSPAASNETVLGRTMLKREPPELLPVSAAVSVDAASAAPIVVEEPSHQVEPQTAGDQAPTIVNEAAAESPGVALASAQVAKTVAPESASAGHSEAVQAGIVANTRESRAAPRNVVAAKAEPVPHKGKDSDVDLIAALVAHVSHGDAAHKEIKRNVGKAASEARMTNGGAKRERRIDSARDIVVRNDGDSTEELVARCRALGLIEGELCRLRICSGLWGRDPSCPGTPSSDVQSSTDR